MNNPFSSDRNLFSNIQRPQRPSAQSDTIQSTPPLTTTNKTLNNNTGINNNNMNTGSVGGARNAYNYANTVTNTNVNSGSNYDGGKGTSNAGYKYDQQPNTSANNKIDLNFRSQFRQTQPTQSITNPYTKVISDKQFPSYSPLSKNNNNSNAQYQQKSTSNLGSSVPSMTIPTNTQKSASVYQASAYHQGGVYQLGSAYQQGGVYQLGSSYQQGSVQGSVSGVEKQKITFGIGSTSGNQKLQYNRDNFINRQQFISQAQPYTSTHSHPSSTPSAPSLSYNYSNTGTNTKKQLPNIMMSPIQQHSKHKYDNTEQFLDLDAMGDDIDKILASSKNQQQLCKLLGIDANNQPSNYVSNAGNYFSNSGNKNMRSMQYSSINRYDTVEQPRNTPLPQSYTPIPIPYQPQQVFNYESPIKPQQLLQSNTIKNSTKIDSKTYISQFQQAINAQMKKISHINKGKTRVFLSASQRIQTVKYNMDVI